MGLVKVCLVSILLVSWTATGGQIVLAHENSPTIALLNKKILTLEQFAVERIGSVENQMQEMVEKMNGVSEKSSPLVEDSLSSTQNVKHILDTLRKDIENLQTGLAAEKLNARRLEKMAAEMKASPCTNLSGPNCNQLSNTTDLLDARIKALELTRCYACSSESVSKVSKETKHNSNNTKSTSKSRHKSSHQLGDTFNGKVENRNDSAHAYKEKNVALGASCQASSEFSEQFRCPVAVDGVSIGGYYEWAWASRYEGVGAWIRLELGRPRILTHGRIMQRFNRVEQSKDIMLAFSDESTQRFQLPYHAEAGHYWDELALQPVKTSWVKITIVTVYSTYNNGFVEIELYARVPKSPYV